MKQSVAPFAEHFANGYLNESTMLWAEGRKEWMSLSSIPELQSAVTSKDQSKQGYMLLPCTVPVMEIL